MLWANSFSDAVIIVLVWAPLTSIYVKPRNAAACGDP